MKTDNKVRKPGILNEFLWICAGVNRKILRECPTDWAKYAGIGGTILFTALMAMLSGGYAFYTIFRNTFTACVFGVFWGLLIFNLDRFMVNTMYSDNKHTISRDEFLGGLPRLILAVFLGVVISVPIELRIFDDYIQPQIQIDQRTISDEIKNKNETLYNERNRLLEEKSTYESKLTELLAGNVNGYASRIAEMEKNLKEAENKLYNETNGTGITGKKGYGPAAQQLQEQVDRLRANLLELKEEERHTNAQNQDYINRQKSSTASYIEELNRQLKEINEQINQVEVEEQKSINASNGFSARLRAMSEITSFEKNPTLFIARLMIMLLFISIEIIPTLFKMMITAGPYDDLLRSENYMAKVMADKRISDINDEINTAIKISTAKNEKKLEAEVLANKELLGKISSVQAELINYAIEAWREEELKKIKENPSAYIKVGISSNPPLA